MPKKRTRTRPAAATRKVDERQRILGGETDRVVDALNVQTSDGYAVLGDVSLLYGIKDPVRVAKDFGWGRGSAFAKSGSLIPGGRAGVTSATFDDSAWTKIRVPMKLNAAIATLPGSTNSTR